MVKRRKLTDSNTLCVTIFLSEMIVCCHWCLQLNVKYKRTDALSLWHQQESTTVGIHGPLQSRGETRCPGGVSVSCLKTQSTSVILIHEADPTYHIPILIRSDTIVFTPSPQKRFIQDKNAEEWNNLHATYFSN